MLSVSYIKELKGNPTGSLLTASERPQQTRILTEVPLQSQDCGISIVIDVVSDLFLQGEPLISSTPPRGTMIRGAAPHYS